MPKNIYDHVEQAKLAPKSFRCSGCPTVIEQGRVYVKTHHGRYCESCADKLGELRLATAT